MQAEPCRLPRTGDALGRADRMLTDLIRHGTDSVGFRDRLPYVLELLAGVSRAIDEESRGARTQRFSEWWSGEPIPHRQELYSLRHAELKALKGHTSARWDTVINARAKDFPGSLVNDGDTVSTVVWYWADGPFVNEQVLPVLQRYYLSLTQALKTAEALLR